MFLRSGSKISGDNSKEILQWVKYKEIGCSFLNIASHNSSFFKRLDFVYAHSMRKIRKHRCNLFLKVKKNICFLGAIIIIILPYTVFCSISSNMTKSFKLYLSLFTPLYCVMCMYSAQTYNYVHIRVYDRPQSWKFRTRHGGCRLQSIGQSSPCSYGAKIGVYILKGEVSRERVAFYHRLTMRPKL